LELVIQEEVADVAKTVDTRGATIEGFEIGLFFGIIGIPEGRGNLEGVRFMNDPRRWEFVDDLERNFVRSDDHDFRDFGPGRRIVERGEYEYVFHGSKRGWG
jgi:hypothetical protein